MRSQNFLPLLKKKKILERSKLLLYSRQRVSKFFQKHKYLQDRFKFLKYQILFISLKKKALPGPKFFQFLTKIKHHLRSSIIIFTKIKYQGTSKHKWWMRRVSVHIDTICPFQNRTPTMLRIFLATQLSLHVIFTHCQSILFAYFSICGR